MKLKLIADVADAPQIEAVFCSVSRERYAGAVAGLGRFLCGCVEVISDQNSV